MKLLSGLLILVSSLALRSANDFLITETGVGVSLTNVSSNDNGYIMSLSNDLVERQFYIGHDGAFCTVELKHQQTGQTYLRSLSPEGNTSKCLRVVVERRAMSDELFVDEAMANTTA